MSNQQPLTTLMPVDEHRQLNEFNQTDWHFQKEETLLSLFKKAAGLYPDHTAVVCKDTTITYKQLDQSSDWLRDTLLEIGVGAGSFVPVLLERSSAWLTALLAVIKTGAAYVPIDPDYPEKRLLYILKDTEATVLLTSHSLSNRVRDINIPVITMDHSPDSASYISPHKDSTLSPDSLAYTIYTSGSTGIPKGVKVNHKSIQHLITWHNQYFQVTPESRLSWVAGLAFDISVWEIWSSLCAGATLYIADSEERTNADALLHYYSRHHITHGFAPSVLTPSVIARSRNCTGLSLKYLFTGGEKLQPVSTKDLPYELIDYYGPTECTVFATFRKVVSEDGSYVPSIGRPIANTQAYILGNNQELLPIGATGELHIGGIVLSQGYLNNLPLTTEKFIRNPFNESGVLYRTGDLAQWHTDGTIRFLGRMDNQVKIRGYRIETGEIEAALLNQDHIKDATVVARGNKGGNQYLIAFVVTDSTAGLNMTTVRNLLKEELPSYMIPAQIIPVDHIPMTPNGKTDTLQLFSIADADTSGTLLLEPPTNPTEQTIAEIWSVELERPVINITDNFFDIGGDSFLVAVVTVAIGEKLGTKVYIRDLYQHPVLQDLANMLIARARETSAPTEDMEPYVELQNDVYLHPDTTFNHTFEVRQITAPKAILLTGITGFVGIHLVQELLQTTKAVIYCLIRAQDTFQAIDKIKQCFKQYKINSSPDDFERIVPVIGDLSQSFLGLQEARFNELASTTDLIYPSASSVNFIEPYSYMKQPNVEGLREIIRFAGMHKTKCLALLSTISVYSWGHVFTGKQVMTEQDDIAQNLLSVSKDIGYVRSKWVMEAIADLAAAKGLPLITYRLGYAMCHSSTGASADYQWWSGLVKNCIEFNSYPALRELREGLITVDYMTQAISHITKNPEAIGKKFNLITRPENNLTLEQFFDLLNQYYDFDMQALPYKTWRKQWEDDTRNRLYPLTSLFRDNMHEGLSTVELYQDTYVWDCSNVLAFLEGSEITEPVFDKALLDAYLQYLKIPVATT